MSIKSLTQTVVVAAVVSFSLISCSRGISGVNSSDPYVAEQAQKAKSLQNQVEAQEKIVDTEKQKLKALEVQFDGAKQNLKGRKAAAKV